MIIEPIWGHELFLRLLGKAAPADLRIRQFRRGSSEEVCSVGPEKLLRKNALLTLQQPGKRVCQRIQDRRVRQFDGQVGLSLLVSLHAIGKTLLQSVRQLA